MSCMIIFLLHHISGHGKFETLGALGISGMLLLTGGGIAWHAVDILMVWKFKHQLLCGFTHSHEQHNLKKLQLSILLDVV